MDKYIADHSATREAGSLTVYRSVKNHLQAYQDTTGHKVTFESIDYNFFQRLQIFLINRIKTDKAGNTSPMLNNTTIAKALSTSKTFLGYARREGLKVNDSYRDFVIKKEKLEVIALDQEEFDAVMNVDLLGNKRLEKTRDIFCFACATGLRYSDIAQLRREHISNNVIALKVKKTKTDLTIPLNSISASILQKYNDHHKPLSMVSNQNLNYSIKDLCKLAGINKPIEIVRFSGKKRIVNVYPKYELIHFHTGRKTFVILSLEKGMSSEEVMEITGHSDYMVQYRGKYKKVGNDLYTNAYQRAVVVATTPPKWTSNEMTYLIEWTKNELKSKRVHPLIIISAFIYEFLCIHPFTDGNGRTSRILTHFLLIKSGFDFARHTCIYKVIEDERWMHHEILLLQALKRNQEGTTLHEWIRYYLIIIEIMMKQLV